MQVIFGETCPDQHVFLELNATYSDPRECRVSEGSVICVYLSVLGMREKAFMIL